MIQQLSWKVGGQQGEGIDSTAEIFSSGFNKLGFYLYESRNFSSRIKGGHTSNKIRISNHPFRSISDDLDILVAFDQETIDVNAPELRNGGIIIADEKFSPAYNTDEERNITLYSIPFTKIAENLGTSLMKNMVSVGASIYATNAPIESFFSVIEGLFSRKGESVVAKNIAAFKEGYDAMERLMQDKNEHFTLAAADKKERLFMIGNDAIAFGALCAGVRFMPAYPITPASEIMEYLIKKLPKFGGTVIQTEDEIAAITMAIGANYAGARSFTASSGPGLSLMMEAIGLSGMTETPVVIVDTQRGGPSTGLPTKQEQSDINAMIYGTHGEIPKIVLAPSTVEDCFYDTIAAFNLAEIYQCPVIIMTDLSLSLGKQTAEVLDYNKININRGKIIKGGLEPLEDNELFKRYSLTEDHISPRPIPGTKNGIHHVTGVEHSEFGRPSEDPVNRNDMMGKRLHKLDDLDMSPFVHARTKHKQADLLFIGINSTYGSIGEAIGRLEEESISCNHIQIRILNPFPMQLLLSEIKKAKKVIIVENNATAQLANLVKLNCGNADKIHSILKYDGNPFSPSEICKKVKELF